MLALLSIMFSNSLSAATAKEPKCKELLTVKERPVKERPVKEPRPTNDEKIRKKMELLDCSDNPLPIHKVLPCIRLEKQRL